VAHPVMWFEVLGKDGNILQTFYGSLFGWTFDTSNPTKYGLAQTGDGRGIPGGVGTVSMGTRPWVTFYVETPDVDASLTRAQQLGGKVVMQKTTMPDVTLAVFEDPEGHAIGLVQAKAV
jgi:uncharacterized protein